MTRLSKTQVEDATTTAVVVRLRAAEAELALDDAYAAMNCYEVWEATV